MDAYKARTKINTEPTLFRTQPRTLRNRPGVTSRLKPACNHGCSYEPMMGLFRSYKVLASSACAHFHTWTMENI